LGKPKFQIWLKIRRVTLGLGWATSPNFSRWRAARQAW